MPILLQNQSGQFRHVEKLATTLKVVINLRMNFIRCMGSFILLY
jgi:hypothetical protein